MSGAVANNPGLLKPVFFVEAGLGPDAEKFLAGLAPLTDGFLERAKNEGRP